MTSASHGHAQICIRIAPVFVAGALNSRGMIPAGDLKQADATLDATNDKVATELIILFVRKK
jgi:hypothetical protein